MATLTALLGSFGASGAAAGGAAAGGGLLSGLAGGGLLSTLAEAGLGMSIGSQILGGLSSMGESSSQAAAYAAQAKIARQQAANQAAQERTKYQKLAGQQRAAFGASGVDVNVGSPLDVLADTDAEGAASVMQILYSGELDAWNAKQRAAAAKSSGKSGLLSGLVGGLSTGLWGANMLGLLGGGTSAGAGLGSSFLGSDSYSASLASVNNWWRG